MIGRMIKNILAAYDGSETAESALEFAVELAKAFQASLHVLTVAGPLENSVSVELDASPERARRHGEERQQPARARLASLQIPTHFHVAVGQAKDEIVRYAGSHAIDHILVGHRGHTFLERWVIGSVARHVIAQAPCAVTVVRKPA